ncbi:MAG: outer membrane beta-barrel protein [Pirellulaceae bacterium]
MIDDVEKAEKPNVIEEKDDASETPAPISLDCGDNKPDIEIGGWSQLGYHNRSTGMFNNHPDQLQLHQTWLYAEKIADGSQGLGFGFRIDYVYGTDGPDTQAFGNPPGSWDIDWDNGGFYGSALPQLYGEVAMGDLSFKVGHFFTTVGYEVVPANGNFFYSHAYTMYNSEPFTHTGVLGSLDMGDVNGYFGWTAGWDTGFDQFGGSNFLGGFSVDLSDTEALTYMATVGKIGNGTDQQGYSHSLVYDVAVTDRLDYVIQSDLVDFNSTGAGDKRSIGLNQYLLYDLNDKWRAGTRFEWWRTEVSPGDNADLLAWTVGLNYQRSSHLVFRPELRWNRDNQGVLIPAGDNQKIGFGCDMIYTY